MDQAERGRWVVSGLRETASWLDGGYDRALPSGRAGLAGNVRARPQPHQQHPGCLMNSRGRRSHSPVPGDAPQLLRWLGMIAAALVGGLAAARLGHASLLVAVIVSVVLGVVFAMVPWPGPPRE